MLTPQPVTLGYGRVTLEPWTEQHDAGLLEAAQDDAIWQWLPVQRPQTLSDLHRMRVEHPGLAWAVIVDGVPAGSTSYLDIDLTVGGLEIGYTWYRRDLWAGDVNPTCKLLLLTQAFEVLGAERVTLKTDALNTRSQAAIARLGATRDGTLRHHRRRPDGSVRDTVYFSLLAAEWPDIQPGLIARTAIPG